MLFRMYEPPTQEVGGCRETLLLVRIAFQILMPPILAIMGLIVIVVLTFALLARHPLLALIPVSIFAFGLYLLIRWDRGNRDHMLDDLGRDDGPYRHG